MATEAVKKILRKEYEKTCNAYVLELGSMWEWDCDAYGYWVADDVGGVYTYGDFTFIDMSNIIYCVENDVKEDEYDEWQEYTIFASEFNQTIPSFPSWHKGCPRLSEAEQQKLRDLKRDLDAAIKDYKNRY